MKEITIRELHARTGQWVRLAAQYGEIRVTDSGHTVAKLVPENEPENAPYFSQRNLSPQFQRLAASGKLARGTDSTAAISEDREEREP